MTNKTEEIIRDITDVAKPEDTLKDLINNIISIVNNSASFSNYKAALLINQHYALFRKIAPKFKNDIDLLEALMIEKLNCERNDLQEQLKKFKAILNKIK